MKRLVSLIIVIVFVIGSIPITFATYMGYDWSWYRDFTEELEVNTDDLYPNVPWFGEEYKEKRLKMYMDESEKRGYLTPAEKTLLSDILDSYINMFDETNEYLYSIEEYSEREKLYFKKYIDKDRDYRMFKDGKQIFICYTSSTIESLIDLMTYGIINENDRVLNLNAVPTRADGIIMAVKMYGGEDEALKGNIESPYIEVPEYAIPYVAYANKVGLLNPVVNGTKWDDSNLTYDEMRRFYTRVLEYKVSDGKEVDNVKTDSYAYACVPDMSSRFGTTYDYSRGGEVLQMGEPLRNGDLISIADKIINEKIKGSRKRLIDKHVDKKIVGKDLKKYMDIKDYFVMFDTNMFNRGEDVNDFTKLLYQYSRDYSQFSFVTFSSDHTAIGYRMEPENMIAYFQISTFNNSEDEAETLIYNVLVDLGLSDSKAEKYASSVLSVPFKRTKDVVTGEHEVKFNKLRIVSSYVDYNNLIVVEIYRK
jgi:hypothetical protein